MKNLLILLSDLHIGVDEEIINRADVICRSALSGLALVEKCVVVVAGDITQSGSQLEYDLSEKFFNEIRKRIKFIRNVELDFFFAPGNHDCVLTNCRAERNDEVTALRLKPTDKVVANKLIADQEAFWNFVHKISPKQSKTSPWISDIKLDNLHFYSINSALTATIQEDLGKLVVDLNCFYGQQNHSSIIKIAVMHHPINWLHNGRDVLEQFKSQFDILICGHEHQNRAKNIATVPSGEQILVLDCHVLFEHKSDYFESAFLTLQIDDTATHMQKTIHKWNRDIYQSSVCEIDIQHFVKGRRSRTPFSFSDSFRNYLDDTGIGFTNLNGRIKLGEIFLWPEIFETTSVDNVEVLTRKCVTTDAFKKLLEHPVCIIIYGAEHSGKTCLIKNITLNRTGLCQPLLLNRSDFSSFKDKAIEESIKKKIIEIYGSSWSERFNQLSPSERIIIFDDFDKINCSKTEKGKLIDKLRYLADRLIFSIEKNTELDVENNQFETLNVPKIGLEIQPIRYVSRIKLIEKWLALEITDESTLASTSTRLSKIIDEALGRNLIPCLPMFVLMLLQQIQNESSVSTVIKNGSQGFLYEQLITQALIKKSRVFDITTALTYLSEFGMVIYQRGVSSVKHTEMRRFHDDHCKKFEIILDFDTALKALIDIEIFEKRNDEVFFKYPYLEFFSIARGLIVLPASDLNRNLDRLILSAHEESAANILLFIAHLSKDLSVITKLIATADSLLVSIESKNLEDLKETYDSINEAEVRLILSNSRSDNLNSYNELRLHDEPEGNFDVNFLASAQQELTASIKVLNVLGQALKNQAGAIQSGEKGKIAKCCIALGLRIFAFSYFAVEAERSTLVKVRAAVIKENDSKISHSENIVATTKYLANLVVSLGVSSVLRICNAIGSEQLSPTLKRVCGDFGESGKIISLALNLEHFDDFPETELLDLIDEYKREHRYLVLNAIARRFVIRRFYLFPESNELKKRVCNKVGIEVQQRNGFLAKSMGLNKF